LEDTTEGIANFHLVFLLRLLTFLGISPNAGTYTPNAWFDLQNGIFTPHPPLHRNYLNQAESLILTRLLRISYENMPLYTFSRHDRVNILRKIITYYRLHLPEITEIKSLAILQTLFG
jgi:DNA repair protein RecO (recombination protein O)